MKLTDLLPKTTDRGRGEGEDRNTGIQTSETVKTAGIAPGTTEKTSMQRTQDVSFSGSSPGAGARDGIETREAAPPGTPNGAPDSSNEARHHVPDPAFTIICRAHEELVEAYEALASPWRRKSVREYFLDPTIKRVEAAVNELARVASDPKAADAVKRDALRKVGEGMDYWLRLFRRKMGEAA